ncbi:hypothetical protein LCGC14_2223750 [marine sediment metagenome]|uniref:Uncharacterized protein n=1 Tax=marine sediment metagenome TaxID=412755 RepID=A0A0F9DXP7_9ZZZZ
MVSPDSTLFPFSFIVESRSKWPQEKIDQLRIVVKQDNKQIVRATSKSKGRLEQVLSQGRLF